MVSRRAGYAMATACGMAVLARRWTTTTSLRHQEGNHICLAISLTHLQSSLYGDLQSTASEHAMNWIIGRYTTFILVLLGALASGTLALSASKTWLWATTPLALLTLLGVYDLTQCRHSILRNYPILGNLRFLFEFIRPAIRQYFLEYDTKAAPFSRAYRTLDSQRETQVIDTRPFDPQEDVYAENGRVVSR